MVAKQVDSAVSLACILAPTWEVSVKHSQQKGKASVTVGNWLMSSLSYLLISVLLAEVSSAKGAVLLRGGKPKKDIKMTSQRLDTHEAPPNYKPVLCYAPY